MSVYATAAEVRTWLRERMPGACGDRGSLPADLIKLYDRAHPERPYRGVTRVERTDSPRLGQGRWPGYTAGGRAATVKPTPEGAPTVREVRAWANANSRGGCPPGGALPRAVVVAWNRTHPDRQMKIKWQDLDTDGERAQARRNQHRLGGLRKQNPHATLED